MTFKELNITEPILKAIGEKGYTVPTPIQEKAIPPVQKLSPVPLNRIGEGRGMILDAGN